MKLQLGMVWVWVRVKDSVCEVKVGLGIVIKIKTFIRHVWKGVVRVRVVLVPCHSLEGCASYMMRDDCSEIINNTKMSYA